MTRTPIVSAKQLERALIRIGFQIVRQRGSHVFYKQQTVERPQSHTMRAHDIARSLLHENLREINLSVDELLNALE